MDPTTRLLIQQSTDAAQAEHWKVQGVIKNMHPVQ